MFKDSTQIVRGRHRRIELYSIRLQPKFNGFIEYLHGIIYFLLVLLGDRLVKVSLEAFGKWALSNHSQESIATFLTALVIIIS